LEQIDNTDEGKAIVYEKPNDEISKRFAYTIASLILAVGAGLGVGIVTDSAIVGVAAGIGGIIIAGLLLVTIIKDKSTYQTSQETNYIGVGVAIGAGLGVAYGLVLSTTLDNPAFLGAGIPLGVGPGIAIGAALNARSKRDDHKRHRKDG
jgi:hypothetical protein